MGPTNVALVKLYQSDQALREAQERLDAASKNVRVQDRRTNDLAEKLKLAQATLKDLQSKGFNIDLEIKSRDAQIDKLRNQQQNAKNNKEYQAFLIEINTQKVDKAKSEEESMVSMEAVEKLQAEVKDLSAQLEGERAKLAELKAAINDTVAKLQAEVDSLKPAREAASQSMPPNARDMFDRLADHHDGEAMSALLKPDRRREEYVCSACMMELVVDVYNKLHTRDDIVFCPSCRRILYIPADLPPELAVNQKRAVKSLDDSVSPSAPKTPRKRKPTATTSAEASENSATPVVIEPRAKGAIGDLLTAAQGESVKAARDADQKPVECNVTLDGKFMGIYKAKTPENLERVIRFIMDEKKVTGVVQVVAIPQVETPQPEAPAATESVAESTEPNGAVVESGQQV